MGLHKGVLSLGFQVSGFRIRGTYLGLFFVSRPQTRSPKKVHLNAVDETSLSSCTRPGPLAALLGHTAVFDMLFSGLWNCG